MNKLDESDISHLISGQVILDMKNAVKELVENALDENATTITVQLKNYGLDGIIVTDDGIGIGQDDFQALCTLHSTAKINDFDDIQSLRGFGFRGEALASLAVLGKLNVHTATEYDQVGYYLEYNHDGTLESIVPKARRRGTTVELQRLFCNLPVRGKELVRNISKEYGKTIDLLYSYGIIAVGVKIVVMKDSTVIFQTNGTRNQIDTINSLFGSKLVKTLIPFSWTMDKEYL
jgi:DNA mismatch repair protein PMS2